MALRKSLSRRRILAGVFAPTALGVVAAAAIVLPQQDTPTVADPYLAGLAKTTECHDMVSLGIGGRGDIPRDESKMLVDENGNRLPAAQQGAYRSHWVEPVISAPLENHEAGDGYAAIYIEYPADLASYENAVNKGAENTIEVMKAIRRSCPDTQFAIVGFSEGADVARRAAMQIGAQEQSEDGSWEIIDPDAVSGVVILSDAGREAGEGFFPGAENGTNPDGFDRPYQPGSDAVSGRGVLPDTNGGFGHLAGKVASFCSEGDFTCSAPENIALIELLANVGRQVNGDALEREGLTPATGADLAQVVGRVALLALADISANPDWMRSDETFLEVLIKVSDPSYDPAARPTTPVAADADSGATREDGAEAPIPAERLSNLAYLPEKIVKEVVGFIRSNQNTLAVVLADPYDQTFGYDRENDDHYGHHFDYWDDDIDGKGTSTVEYAAAWLEHLARQAKEGNAVDANKVDKAAVLMIAEETAKAETAEASTTPETSPSSTVTDDATVADSSVPTPVDAVPAPAGDPAAPVAPPAPEAGVTTATPTPMTTTAPVSTPSETTTPATGETTTGAGSTTSSGTPTTTVVPTTTSPAPAA